MRFLEARNLIIWVIVWSLTLISGTVASSQVPDETVYVTSDFVTVPVNVLDRNGRYVSGLQQTNFKLFENGVPQMVDFFERAEKPVTVLLLFDTSGSMNSYLVELARSATVFVSQMKADD